MLVLLQVSGRQVKKLLSAWGGFWDTRCAVSTEAGSGKLEEKDH